MGVRARQFGGRPCDCLVALRARIRRCRLPMVLPCRRTRRRELLVRAIGLDVHRDFCEVAISEAGNVRSQAGSRPAPKCSRAFAASLTTDDRVVLEVTGNAWEIAR